MLETGKVQFSQNSKISHVANPADQTAFKAAKPGSVYVEFDVLTDVLQQGGTDRWGIIIGPNSVYDRLNQQRGLPPIKETPDVANIRLVGRK